MSKDPAINRTAEPGDGSLLEEMRRGDMRAFNTLFGRHSRRAIELAGTIVSDRHTAEEIVSDVFFSFWVRRASLPPIPSFQAYLFTAVRYRARKVLQAQKSMAFIVPLEDHAPALQQRPAETFGQQPSDKLALTLHRAIEGLPPQRKLIFKLKRIDGLTYKAIASLLDISESTVKNQLVMALKTLRDHLAVYQVPLSVLLCLYTHF